MNRYAVAEREAAVARHAAVWPRVWAGVIVACYQQAGAQVYVGGGGAGESVMLSNFQSSDTPTLLIAPQSPTATVPGGTGTTPRRFAASGRLAEIHALVDDAAKKVDISSALIRAVISTESGYNEKAVSSRGAMGLMQLMPETAKRFGVNDPFIAKENILGGATYLKWLMALFNNDISLVLAAYNAGEQAVIRAQRKIPEYPETQDYVRRVMARLSAANS